MCKQLGTDGIICKKQWIAEEHRLPAAQKNGVSLDWWDQRNNYPPV